MNDNFLEFTPDELTKAASSMKGVPVVINLTGAAEDDHAINSSMNTIGWTTSSYFDGMTLWGDAEITNPDVIPKFLRETSDGKRELNYVSMGAEIVPICSICSKDIRECGHERGKNYDGKLCKVYATQTKFNHLACTNQPADKGARIGTVQVAASSLNKWSGMSKIKKIETSTDSGVPAPATTPRGYNLTVGPGITVEQYALAHQREHEALDAKMSSVGAKLDALIEGLEDELEGEDTEEVVDMIAKKKAKAGMQTKQEMSAEDLKDKIKAELEDELKGKPEQEMPAPEKTEEESFVLGPGEGGETTTPELYGKTKDVPSEQKQRFPVTSEAEVGPNELQKKIEEVTEEEESLKRQYAYVAKAHKALLMAAKELVKADDIPKKDEEEEEASDMGAPAVPQPKAADSGPDIKLATDVKYPGGVSASKKLFALASKLLAKAEEEKEEEEPEEDDEEAVLKKLTAMAEKENEVPVEKMESDAGMVKDEQEKVETEESHAAPLGVTNPQQDEYQKNLRSGQGYPQQQFKSTKDTAAIQENAELKSRLERLEKQRKFELATSISRVTKKPAREYAAKSLNEVEVIWETVKDLPQTEGVKSKVPEFASYDENFGPAKETAEERITKYGVTGALKYAIEEDIKSGKIRI